MMRQVVSSLVFVGALCCLLVLGTEPPRERIVVINEVCWAGAAWDPTAEWIELKNNTPHPVSLDGWVLRSSDGAPHVQLSGTIPPLDETAGSGYFLLVRGEADRVPGISADVVYEGALSDAGETLFLIDDQGHTIDTANVRHDGAPRPPWPAGTHAFDVPPFASMERIDPTAPDIPSNWASSVAVTDEDAARPVHGTPGRQNSVYLVPPVAQIAVHPALPQPGMPVRFRAELLRDSSRPIVAFRWALGDGTVMPGQDVTHIYSTEGTYEVTLFLVDGLGHETVLRQQIRVVRSSPPVVDFSVLRNPHDPVLRVGDIVSFTDESFSHDAELVTWEWSLGDGGQASGRQVTHSYASVGTYVIQLTVTQVHGLSSVQTQSLVIAPPRPVAHFSFAPDPPHSSLPVTFDATGSFHSDSEITIYRWDFNGDGVIDRVTEHPIVEHIYEEAGTFRARLTVEDAWSGRGSFDRTVSVHARPTAQFSASTFTPDEQELVSFTDRSSAGDAPIVQWAWEFGDGAESDEPSPGHTFSGSGPFDISLTVTDAEGATDTASMTINVHNLPPIAALSVADAVLPTGQRFALDASSSHDPSPEGGIVAFAWSLCADCDFGDPSTSPVFSPVFSEPGTYSIRVRVTDNAGATAISSPVAVTATNRPPQVSSITWDPKHPVDGEEVAFSASASDPDGHITDWVWTWGDDTFSTASEPTRVFLEPGVHSVSLQVRDNHGAVSVPYHVEIFVANAPPVAVFTVAPGTLCQERSLRFDASASYDPSPLGSIVHVAWDFGDGTSCPGRAPGCTISDRWRPEHCYSHPGTYTVTLFVVDDKGALSTAERTISIHE